MGRQKRWEPIPIPLSRRWHAFRMRVLPVMVFAAALIAFCLLWLEHVSPPTMLGEAQGLQAQLASPAAGTLDLLHIQPFDAVQPGQLIGLVITASPELVERSLAVVAAEIEKLRVGMEPLVNHQRNEINYEGLRLDWMMQRVALATARVHLQRAETEHRRLQELFHEGIIAESQHDGSRLTYEALQVEVRTLEEVVNGLEAKMASLANGRGAMPNATDGDRLQAAIAVQEQQLLLTEAQLSPVPLHAPIGGMVSGMHRNAGEFVLAGEPILTIDSPYASQVVGYLRQPLAFEPEVGARVEVRPRDRKRGAGMGEILSVGVQMGPIAPGLLRPLYALDANERALPVQVSVPSELQLRPGEILELSLVREAGPSKARQLFTKLWR